MSRDTLRLDPRQVEFAEKFLSSREPANHVLLGPVGLGKERSCITSNP